MCMCACFFQVGKAWAPSVVYIGDCEKTWQKKVPKTDKVTKQYSYCCIEFILSLDCFLSITPISRV